MMTPMMGTARRRTKIKRQMAYIIPKKAAMQSSKGKIRVMFAHKADLLTQGREMKGRNQLRQIEWFLTKIWDRSNSLFFFTLL